jgi:hypothetical protein
MLLPWQIVRGMADLLPHTAESIHPESKP